MSAMRAVISRDGFKAPVVGQGTWEMGVRDSERAREVAALQRGFELGLWLVDTAEMYADGGAEKVVGEAIRGRRDQVLVVSKVLPNNASRNGTMRACERSLKRLGTDTIDLYLLHWPGPEPLEETLAAFVELRQQGKIRHYGVSNFDIDDMQQAEALLGGSGITCNQVFYNLNRRSMEGQLLPWCLEREVLIMAYTPYDQGRLQGKAALQAVARRHNVTPEQVALAWTIRDPGVVVIPKASDLEHVQQNADAAVLVLSDEDHSELDAAFPRPKRDVPLETV